MVAPGVTVRSSGIPRALPRVVAVVAGLGFVLLGLWGFIAPRSFFDAVATFEPYNQHFTQDVGTFQVGFGVTLLVAVLSARTDGLAVALLGTGVGSALHAVSHMIGHDLGGRPESDIPVFTALALVLLAAGVVR